MKTYHFRDLCISTCIVIVFLCIFLYLLIWLNDGFNVEKQIGEIRKDFSHYKPEGMVYKNEIMNSCFIGQSNGENRQK